MTEIEDRLSEDLKAFAQQAQPEVIRPLRIPPPRRTARTARWLAPVAAAAAVVAVAATVSLAGHSAGNRPDGGQPAAAAAPAGMPPYYVDLTSKSRAVVYDSVTGKVTDTVSVPAGNSVLAGYSGGITAAADDRSFAITTALGIYLLRLGPGGRSATLTTLPLSPTEYVTGEAAALSPDGSQLAVTVEQSQCPHSGCNFGIEVYSIATGAQRTWWGPVSGNLSWSGDGKQIMWLEASETGNYLLLNTTRPAGTLLADSRRLPIPYPPFGQLAALTPDGSGVVTSTLQIAPGHILIGKIVELSASTGRLLRVLHTASAHYSGEAYALGLTCAVQALGPVGVQPLVQCFGLGRIEGSQFTKLPGSPVRPGSSGVRGFASVWSAAW